MAASNDWIYIFVEGPDHTLVDWSQQIGQGAWYRTQDEGDDTVYSAPAGWATTSHPGITTAENVGAAYEGPQNDLQYYWVGTDEGSGTETVAGAGTTLSAPAIVNDNNDVSISAQANNNSLNFYWQPDGGSGWNRERVAYSGSTFSSPAMAEGNNAISIAAQGPTGSLSFYWQEVDAATSWTFEVAAPGHSLY
jgi:hypothetical protein